MVGAILLVTFQSPTHIMLDTGVPLIMQDTLPDYLSNNNQYDDAPDWKLFGDFMSTSRINLNIRQVYPRNQSEDTVQ